MAFYNSDSALDLLVSSTIGMAAFRAASQYAVQSWTEAGSGTSVTLTLAGTNYLVLGASRSINMARSDIFNTLRTGTVISATTSPTSSIPSTIATDFNSAIPLVSPYNVHLNGTGSGTGYIGLLRCDI
jgi:hypothetical protein